MKVSGKSSKELEREFRKFKKRIRRSIRETDFANAKWTSLDTAIVIGSVGLVLLSLILKALF